MTLMTCISLGSYDWNYILFYVSKLLSKNSLNKFLSLVSVMIISCKSANELSNFVYIVKPVLSSHSKEDQK